MNGKRRQSGRQSPASDSEDGSDNERPQLSDSTRTNHRLASKLVRYALACEYSRLPIRREGIKENVFGGEKVARFSPIFDLAQTQLRTVFGMEMVELPTKDRAHLTLDQKRKAAKSQTAKSQNRTGATTRSNAYILVSVLPPELRGPKIIAPSKVQSSEGEASYAGFYTTLIAIITLSGGELSEAMFRKFLSRLNADQTIPSMNPSNQNQPSEQTEIVLQRLIRQGYLIKGTAAGEEGDEAITWHVGPRGKVEVDNEAIAGVVRAVFGDATEGLENKLQTSLGVRPREEVAGGAPGHGRARHVQPKEESDDDSGRQQNGNEDEVDEDEEDQPAPRRRRVNTAGQHSPMTIRTREDGDPGSSRRNLFG
ncbi:hypothetical protein DL546_005046 [Coniochaeta pulveracea]|uniref:MAGE domain-containing protein n=1 Tax=Coniochaeta pulveracea TaxID=177199 RepID=A0A420YBX7_9PEZI|nr:hypothetical protein DL546_005046 [Coniochaeta pulveracea]